MIYKFKSRATGDLIMLGPDGDRLLRLLGREPAARGIIECDAMATAIATLQEAIRAAETAGAAGEAAGASSADAGERPDEDPVTLRQRLWPMIDMLRRAAAAGEPVVWGV